MHRFVLVMVLTAALAVFATAAQESAPTAQLQAQLQVPNATPMTFAGSRWLAVGVGTALHLFDVSEPESPFDLATLALGGVPLAVGATDAMVLVAVERESAVDEIV